MGVVVVEEEKEKSVAEVKLLVQCSESTAEVTRPSSCRQYAGDRHMQVLTLVNAALCDCM